MQMTFPSLQIKTQMENLHRFIPMDEVEKLIRNSFIKAIITELFVFLSWKLLLR